MIAPSRTKPAFGDPMSHRHSHSWPPHQALLRDCVAWPAQASRKNGCPAHVRVLRMLGLGFKKIGSQGRQFVRGCKWSSANAESAAAGRRSGDDGGSCEARARSGNDPRGSARQMWRIQSHIVPTPWREDTSPGQPAPAKARMARGLMSNMRRNVRLKFVGSVKP